VLIVPSLGGCVCYPQEREKKWQTEQCGRTPWFHYAGGISFRCFVFSRARGDEMIDDEYLSSAIITHRISSIFMGLETLGFSCERYWRDTSRELYDKLISIMLQKEN